MGKFWHCTVEDTQGNIQAHVYYQHSRYKKVENKSLLSILKPSHLQKLVIMNTKCFHAGHQFPENGWQQTTRVENSKIHTILTYSEIIVYLYRGRSTDTSIACLSSGQLLWWTSHPWMQAVQKACSQGACSGSSNTSRQMEHKSPSLT